MIILILLKCNDCYFNELYVLFFFIDYNQVTVIRPHFKDFRLQKKK